MAVAAKTLNRLTIKDFSKPSEQLAHVAPEDLYPLPPPYDKLEEQPGFKKLTEDARKRFETTLDDTMVVNVPKPKSKEEEERLVKLFISG